LLRGNSSPPLLPLSFPSPPPLLPFQFQSVVNLILMMGLLEVYCIPLYKWHYNPVGFDEKMDNMKLSFRLLQDAASHSQEPNRKVRQ